MKQQSTTPTHVLSLVSYTRKLTLLTAKFSRSLFLLIPAILFSQVSFSQAPSINAAAVNDDQDISSGYFFTAGHVETSIAYDATASSGHLIAFVTDGDGTGYGGFQPEMKAGLTVVDNNGTTNPSYFFPFDAASYSGGSITPTVFRNPDVALLVYNAINNDFRAIITFETDDPVYDSYILELYVSANGTSVGIWQPSSGSLRSPITTSSILATSPRIDGDPTMNRFAVVSIQGGVPTFSIYWPASGSYQMMNPFSNVATGSNIYVTNNAMQPDIALGHIAGTYEPECVISFVDGDPTGNFGSTLYVDYYDNMLNYTQQLNLILASGSPTIFSTASVYPDYPHICSEEEFASTNNMRWALEASLVDPPLIGSNIYPSHMLYVNSDCYYTSPNASNIFYLDDFASTSDNLEKLGAIDWMNDDGFVAWCNEDASTPHVQQIVGVLEPFTNGYSTWDQVYYMYNYNYLTGIDEMQAVSVASDAASTLYVVAEIIAGKLIYKVRGIGSTLFKTSNIPLAKNTYPIPCDNVLHISADAEENICIKDIVGNTVFTTKLYKGINTINTSAIPNGNYILKRNNNSLNTLFSVSH